MTIRFLRQWNGYDDQVIYSLPGIEEARLVGLGIATYQTSSIKSGPVFDSVSDLPTESDLLGVAQVGSAKLTSQDLVFISDSKKSLVSSSLAITFQSIGPQNPFILNSMYVSGGILI